MKTYLSFNKINLKNYFTLMLLLFEIIFQIDIIIIWKIISYWHYYYLMNYFKLISLLFDELFHIDIIIIWQIIDLVASSSLSGSRYLKKKSSVPIPSISITVHGSDTESCNSSKLLDAIEDDVFILSGKDDKDISDDQITKETKLSSNHNSSVTRIIESHSMRKLKILKVKLEKCRICDETVYFRGSECQKVSVSYMTLSFCQIIIVPFLIKSRLFSFKYFIFFQYLISFSFNTWFYFSFNTLFYFSFKYFTSLSILFFQYCIVLFKLLV